MSSESILILPYLQKLTLKGWWTVASQPAVDEMKSSDEVFGWGPQDGYVYQKGFVEFFLDKADVSEIEERVRSRGEDWVDYLASNENVL